jgi:hypothetical protein
MIAYSLQGVLYHVTLCTLLFCCMLPKQIWRSLNDLFEYVLREMGSTLNNSETRLSELTSALETERADREAAAAKHAFNLT